jgi:hypothetical protein
MGSAPIPHCKLKVSQVKNAFNILWGSVFSHDSMAAWELQLLLLPNITTEDVPYLANPGNDPNAKYGFYRM